MGSPARHFFCLHRTSRPLPTCLATSHCIRLLISPLCPYSLSRLPLLLAACPPCWLAAAAVHCMQLSSRKEKRGPPCWYSTQLCSALLRPALLSPHSDPAALHGPASHSGKQEGAQPLLPPPLALSPLPPPPPPAAATAGAALHESGTLEACQSPTSHAACNAGPITLHARGLTCGGVGSSRSSAHLCCSSRGWLSGMAALAHRAGRAGLQAGGGGGGALGGPVPAAAHAVQTLRRLGTAAAWALAAHAN